MNKYQQHKKNHPENCLYNYYKNNAKTRGLLFPLTRKQVGELISQNCYYCENKGGGIDRKDNSIGYLLINCVPCCKLCNRAKLSMTEEQFVDMCIHVARKFQI